MPEPIARLYLVSPIVADAGAFAPLLAGACEAGDVAAVLLRLGGGADERTLLKQIKLLAPVPQERGAAALVSTEGDSDLAALVTRGGADGAHLPAPSGDVRALRERLRDRLVGAGGLRSKDDAMSAGEAGVDYVMFGEPRPDGSTPPLDAVVERSAWWAEIFVTPCVAFAPTLEAVAPLARTGAEFVALCDAVWRHPDGPRAAVRCGLEALLVAQEAA
jgi:thiamine-phosphate pyrophosphorylase